jgi:hypothetical protein
MQKLRNPRMIILNTSVDINPENFREPDTTKPRTSHERGEYCAEILLHNEERN